MPARRVNPASAGQKLKVKSSTRVQKTAPRKVVAKVESVAKSTQKDVTKGTLSAQVYGKDGNCFHKDSWRGEGLNQKDLSAKRDGKSKAWCNYRTHFCRRGNSVWANA